MIPGWIPAHPFWAYFTGVAHIAAGVGIATGVKARLAAILLAVMFGSWVVVLHVPRVAADLGKRPEWTSLFVAIPMCGASWGHRPPPGQVGVLGAVELVPWVIPPRGAGRTSGRHRCVAHGV